MKIEEIIRATSEMSLAKKALLNVLYTQNVVADKFNEILKPHDLSSEQFNVLRILRGQKRETSQYECYSRTHDCKNQ